MLNRVAKNFTREMMQKPAFWVRKGSKVCYIHYKIWIHHRLATLNTDMMTQKLIMDHLVMVKLVMDNHHSRTNYHLLGVFTFFCYPCAVCNLASRTGECFCAPACVPGGEIILRNRIRSVGGIRGSMCDDCCVILCCGPCAACQEARELNNMGVP
ncbi:unnamed protein product [Mytilus coruscus]|uniref:CNFN n=1 Tax=Mytilus coruscus TaxID=42192 RepID=A0A6J8AYA4_MYTCO|nr:unnamed protein product [Mytilus coruscus]